LTLHPLQQGAPAFLHLEKITTSLYKRTALENNPKMENCMLINLILGKNLSSLEDVKRVLLESIY
jgi:hypothetical protein